MKLFQLIFTLAVLIISGQATAAGGGGFGFNGAISTPFLSQYGLNYVNSSNDFSAELVHSGLSLTIDQIGLSGSSDALVLRWHPFQGSFFVGAGIGQKTITVKSNQLISSTSVNAQIEFKATTLTPTLGWLWGVTDGGFFGGFDVGYQTHSGAKSTLTSDADASIKATAEYQALEKDINDQGEKLGQLPLPVITLFRIGYLF